MVLVTKTKPRFSRTHKKRTGQHHRQSKHYAKPYYPYIPIVVVVGLGLLLNIVWGAADSHVLGAGASSWSQGLLADTNTQRVDDNEPGLHVSNRLDAAAQAKANDMVAKNYWSHNAPDGKTPWAFMADAGYKFETAGENLAYGFGSAADTVSGWMSSPGHRANILNANFSQIGFGIAHSDNYVGSGPETVIVAMYGEPPDASIGSDNQSPNVLSDSITAGQPVSQSVSRAAMVSNNLSGLFFVLAAFAACGLLWLTTRHALAWQRVMIRSEQFILKHHLFDTLIISVAMMSYVLTRTAGFIS